MTLIDRHPSDTTSTILLRTDWDGYLKILEAAEGRRIRITYDRGDIELMSLSRRHEQSKKLIAQLVEHAMFLLRVRSTPGGSTTFKRKLAQRGLEPDDCYWIQSFAAIQAEDDEADEVFRPDLAIEVEISRSALDRMAIYRSLGVPEAWRYTAEEELLVQVLGPEGYSPSPHSLALPTLPVAELPRFVRLGRQRSSLDMLEEFGSWLTSVEPAPDPPAPSAP